MSNSNSIAHLGRFTYVVIICGALVWLVWLPVSAAVSPSTSTTLYAAPSSRGSEDCSAWANACLLSNAINQAGSGDEIWVEQGVHYPTTNSAEVTATFHLTDGVAIYGGFVATETVRSQRDWENHVTVLSGDIDKNDMAENNGIVSQTASHVGNNSYHVVTGSGVTITTVLDGFFITAGRAVGASETSGGGMINVNGSPTLNNLSFIGNAANIGGGMSNRANSDPILTHVSFINNDALGLGGEGGGMENRSNSNPVLNNVLFLNNSANSYGGGMFNTENSDVVMTKAEFNNNSAQLGGGGMLNAIDSNPILYDVEFVANSSSDGAGIYNDREVEPTLNFVTFTTNIANAAGGGMYGGVNAILNNVLFAGNQADSGGGLYSIYTSTLTNVAFISNTAVTGSGGGLYAAENLKINNSTFLSNTAAFTGGGLANTKDLNLNHVIFEGNYAAFAAGGLLSFEDLVLNNVSFINNSTDGWGGGMVNEWNRPTLNNVLFSGNSADTGGGVYNSNQVTMTLNNVAFTGNYATMNGGGLYNTENVDGVYMNATFGGNRADNTGGGIYNADNSNPIIINTVMWNNQDSSGLGTLTATIVNDSSMPSISYSLIQGSGGSSNWESGAGVDWGNNIDDDPMFVDQAAPIAAPTISGTYTLQPDSPAINAGNTISYTTSTTITVDLAGNPRIQDGVIDLGAYEGRLEGFFIYLPIVVQE